MRGAILPISYLIASVCFILALQALSSPKHARKGNLLGAVGMLVAVIGTLLHQDILTFKWIALGLILGSLIGGAMSIWIPMTKMPERIALSHAFGGLAAALVGVSEYHHRGAELDTVIIVALGLEVFLGFLTFTGSLMAFGKLQGFITGAPITYKGQNATNITMFLGALVLLVAFAFHPAAAGLFYGMGALGLAVGILAVLPIGGADMPVVISLLNSYAGLASAATGFALGNYVLIIAGALDGTSGFLLSMKMSKAMNRSFANVLFGAFGTGDATPGATGDAAAARYNLATVDDAVGVLDAAQTLIVVPGYGMAVSQAQHALRDLTSALEAKGTKIQYAVHPVAGRMPGHMNVLLAEANIPYDQIFDLDEINDEFSRTDAVLVVGANDVVNPAAKTNPGSAIYGMPVFNVDQARAIIVLKRSMNPGFSGLENDLFGLPNTMMVLGDAKATIKELTAGVRG
ncbi:MAG TPA: NAD(P)(+) transhydrogenase (Re/Si-specific) subunit beta [Thermoanaerobaculia bacterium]|jgi:NAD(P) transhydrogenase subunit beta|nr:NAD(P)(+) transhydrogenase (Re/Si-specific) subunit beta [Thermoanaerobaculia bacterium]